MWHKGVNIKLNEVRILIEPKRVTCFFYLFSTLVAFFFFFFCSLSLNKEVFLSFVVQIRNSKFLFPKYLTFQIIKFLVEPHKNGKKKIKSITRVHYNTYLICLLKCAVAF